MNLVDCSAWLEYFGAGPQAEQFAQVIEDFDGIPRVRYFTKRK